ncbi:MAG: dTDP-4-amino-4,6-dideoxygalactose transaminase [Woeseiaceae bacterium]|nr:dTDP-4-amino-4,6-dideoxygalactose transaminase [Woeseiaceae bacterium]
MSQKRYIPFNKPPSINDSREFITKSLDSGQLAGRGPYTKKCEEWLAKKHPKIAGSLLTTSCTHALEVSAILMNLSGEDEVIVPSFTFVSSALAYHMHGANLRFCDIREDTLNINEDLLEEAITKNTKAIVVVHYAGVSCEMDIIMSIARKHKILVIEDNAHGFFGKYKGVNLGTIGDFSTLSFHATKNISCGEGGALLVNNKVFLERAETIIEKGTNRSNFIKGQIDKYSWIDKGSSYILSDLLAALLYGQFKNSNKIQLKRRSIWERYFVELSEWALSHKVSLPFIPEHCEQTYHMFYLLLSEKKERDNFISFLADHDIAATFHYLPLDKSEMGLRIALNDQVQCPVSKRISDCIVRLPIFYDLEAAEQTRIINTIKSYGLES